MYEFILLSAYKVIQYPNKTLQLKEIAGLCVTTQPQGPS